MLSDIAWQAAGALAYYFGLVVSRDELLAGLRKLGFESPDGVHLAVLEETGHISAVGRK
jgi:hypothetical protein